MLSVLLRKKEQKKLAMLTALSQYQAIHIQQFANEYQLSRPTAERQLISLIADLDTIYGATQTHLKLTNNTITSHIDIHTTTHNPTRTLINYYLADSLHFTLLRAVTNQRRFTISDMMLTIGTTLPYLKKITAELNKLLKEFNLTLAFRDQLVYLDGPPLNLITFTYLLDYALMDCLATEHYLLETNFLKLDSPNKNKARLLSKAITLFQSDLTSPSTTAPEITELLTELYHYQPLLSTKSLPESIDASHFASLNFLFIQTINLDDLSLNQNANHYQQLATNLMELEQPITRLAKQITADFAEHFQLSWPPQQIPYIESAVIVHILSVQLYELNIISRFYRSLKFQYGYRIETEFSAEILAYVEAYQVANYLPENSYYPDLPHSIMFALAIAFQMREFQPITIAVSISTNNMAEHLIKQKISDFINPTVFKFTENESQADLIVADHFLTSLNDRESIIINDITKHQIYMTLMTKISAIYDQKNNPILITAK